MAREKLSNSGRWISLKADFLPLKPFLLFVEAIAVLLSVYVIAQFLPKSLFNELPATGGDTGSHFWPVKVLHDYGIPNLVLRPWNPGNNGGEGLLVHYFPLPFLFMALLGYLIPVGTAFNIGSMLPVVTLPVSIWWAVRLMTRSRLAAVLAAMFSSGVVLNEGYSMWGGNTLSTLAGQFAHMYALNFLVLAIGYLSREMDQKKIPWRSGLLFSCVALSHGYIYFGVPPLLLLLALLLPKRNFRYRVFVCVSSAFLSLCLSLWFIGPMVLNGPWVTAHSFSWVFQNWPEEVLPRILEPTVITVVLAGLVILYQGLRKREFLLFRVTLFWLASGLVYLGFFFVFRWLKLVDVRALPQTQLFIAMGAGCLSAIALQFISKRLQALLGLTFLAFLCYWQTIHVVKFPIWADWNYSGWQSKGKFKELEKLSDALRGDLSLPRVAYEHHVKNNQVGTERVFEMLPYFANRATTESLYLQSTVLAPMIYSLTSEISQAASCPFHQWPCMRLNILGSQGRQELLGIKELILSSEVSLNQAKNASFLQERFKYGPWTVYENKNSVPMAEVFNEPPITISFENWRNQFWQWFRDYKKGSRFLVTAKNERDLPASESFANGRICHPQTRVDFSGIELRTDCPGVAHYLKYAFHPSFTSSGGESLFLVSPGFLGVVPKTHEIKITFGSSWIWGVFRALSFLSLLGLTAFLLKGRKKYGLFLKKPFFLGGGMKVVESPKSSLKKKTTPQKTVHTSRLLPFYLFLGSLVMGYGYISYQTDSLLFWNWRNLNFSDFEIISHQQGYGVLHKNENLNGKPIVLKGAIRYSGLATHANSNTRIRIKSNKRFFAGICGYPDHAHTAKVRCEIRSQGRTFYSSPPLGDDNRESFFMVPVTRGQELELIVNTLKNNITAAHAVWVDLRLTDPR